MKKEVKTDLVVFLKDQKARTEKVVIKLKERAKEFGDRIKGLEDKQKELEAASTGFGDVITELEGKPEDKKEEKEEKEEEKKKD